MSNPIANRVERIKAGNDPQFLAKMASGYAILSNQQPDEVTGCCMLLPDPTPAHLNDLTMEDRSRFLLDLSLLGDAVQEATGCARLNYLMLCNQVPWLHGHVVPRFAEEAEDKFKLDPFAAYDFPSARKADATGPDKGLFEKLREALKNRIDAVERTLNL